LDSSKDLEIAMRAYWLIGIAALPMALPAQNAGQLGYDSAYYAWNAGDYPDALTRFKRLLGAPGGERFIEPIALLTGELFTAIEVVPADRHVIALMGAQAPKWSPDGRYFAFETTMDGRRRALIHRLENGRAVRVMELDGSSVTFTNDGARVAFLRVVDDDELRKARAELARLSGTDRQAVQRQQQAINALETSRTVVIERELASGRETTIPAQGITRTAVHFNADNQLFVTGSRAGTSEVHVFRVSGTDEAIQITAGPTSMRVIQALADGHLLLSLGNNAFGVVAPDVSAARTYEGSSVSASADGRWLVFLSRAQNQNALMRMPVSGGAPTLVKSSLLPLANPALSPDGSRVVFQMMPREDWELYTIDANGQNEARITREIQHDHTPRFLTSTRLLGVMGENRHRRSYVYDPATRARTRLFHNNQIRTVAMEYAWAVSPDGSKVLIVADRDGDTISPERGVYVMDLTREIGNAELSQRLDRMQAAESELRERGRRMFAGIAARVRTVVQDASAARVYGYERAMFDFDSKFITQPGNQKAAEFIFNTLKSFGYEPEYQWFEARGVRTANVIATLRGTTNPELIYVVSSHYDSVERGPGADDDTSGSAALLEAARILAGKPMPATIKFAWFTGEEAGLLGSREFVRQAVGAGARIVGALNNDMIGFANDDRLDNTIRYSNAGLRDLQHAAAFLFTNLITYDSKYYQSTDAAAYYDAYGDIVGGIGSYPILGNPHYHQPHDVLETINHQLVTEVAKTTAASLMLMASSPARLKDLMVSADANGARAQWTAAAESSVTAYIVRYWPGGGQPRDVRVPSAHASLPGARPGDAVWVKAVNSQGMESWDWARAIVPQTR
jgi:Tol biopolymer transport system component